MEKKLGEKRKSKRGRGGVWRSFVCSNIHTWKLDTFPMLYTENKGGVRWGYVNRVSIGCLVYYLFSEHYWPRIWNGLIGKMGAMGTFPPTQFEVWFFVLLYLIPLSLILVQRWDSPGGYFTRLRQSPTWVIFVDYLDPSRVSVCASKKLVPHSLSRYKIKNFKKNQKLIF